MLLELTTTYNPATHLGFLLHKHPDKLQTVELSTGRAHIFYPVADYAICTACLALDINPVDLVRNKKGSNVFLQQDYVNDRPYTSNSFLSTAIVKAFGSAINGTCHEKPELPKTAIPLIAKVYSLKVDTDFLYLKKLFEPLGYTITYEVLQLDDQFISWGQSKYINLEIRGTITLKELLSHLYVFILALDNERHYWVTKNDIEVLLRRGENWLDNHPEKEWIIKRYLKNLRTYTSEALLRLAGDEIILDGQPQSERKISLHQKRLEKALVFLKASNAESVLDIGCGDGKLLKLLLKDSQFRKIAGTDVSFSELQKAKDNLHLNEASPAMKERINLFQGSVTYKDERFKGFDAVALVEVIEHLDQERLSAMEKVVFGYAQPHTIVLSTPNAEYNQVFAKLEEGSFRHEDHRFEWKRNEFKSWCEKVSSEFSYEFIIYSVGDEEPNLGAPSQLAVFKKR
jgi:3' terminal RNA ribose 2'-O-methyltransferase Hen1